MKGQGFVKHRMQVCQAGCVSHDGTIMDTVHQVLLLPPPAPVTYHIRENVRKYLSFAHF